VLALGALALLCAWGRGVPRAERSLERGATEAAAPAEPMQAAPAPAMLGARVAQPATPAVPAQERLLDRHAAELAARARAAAADPDDPPPLRWLVGRLLLADGSPASGDVLTHVAHDARMRHAGEARAELGPFGDFRIPLQPGYLGMRLVAKARDHAPFDRWIELDPLPGEQDVGILALSAGGSIAGEVRLGASDPSGWSVLVMTAAAELPGLLPRASSRTAFLDALGRFELKNVPPGFAELSLHHRLLGTVAERDVDVRAGGPTRVDLAYDGPDPARLLVVRVDALRPPKSDEIRLEGARGLRLAPDSITGARVLFSALEPDHAYTLVLALADEERPVFQSVRAGTRTTITAPSVALRARDAEQRSLVELEGARKRAEAARAGGRRRALTSRTSMAVKRAR
jgi:hypothetical protein